MNSQDIKLNCSQCGRKVGILTLSGGTMNVMRAQICCLACLPKRLDELEKEGYNPSEIESARNWSLQY